MKIIIIGLLGKSESMIEKKFPKVKFRFIDIDANYAMPDGDYCVLMKKFINHGWQEKAFNAFPRDRVLIVPGSMTNLFLTLETLINKDK